MQNLRMISDEPCFVVESEDEDDVFNHEVIADILLGIIKDNNPPLTVGLFGGWGIGKSSIVNLFSRKIKEKEYKKDYGYVYFNAWQYSGDSFRRQFLLAVADSEEIIRSADERNTEIERLRKLNHASIEKPKEKISVSRRGLVVFGVSVVLLILGVLALYSYVGTESILALGGGLAAVVVSVITLLSNQVQQLIKVEVDRVIDPRLIFPEQFGEEFRNLIEKSKAKKAGRKIVIVIDDLDRCDLQTINSVLVSLKNFLGTKDCYFIVPMDDSSVVQMFAKGNTNFGYEQLRKYFSVSVRVPGLHNHDIIHFAKRAAREYEIPPEVAYIAAVGYCKDARKMKHFLNLYKIKMALAQARKARGYLEMDLESLRRQLAKLVVLEYQYPEFFRVVCERPKYLDFFTKAARGEEAELENDEILREFGDDIYESKKPINAIWKKYAGLRKFLSDTIHIEINDIDKLAKLKITSQENELGDLGTWLRDAVSSSSITNYAEMLTPDNLADKNDVLVEALVGYIGEEFQIVAENAVGIANYIIRNQLVSEEFCDILFESVTSYVTANRWGVKISGDTALMYLGNLHSLSSGLQRQLTKKLNDDVLQQDVFYADCWTFFNHSNFYRFDFSMLKDIDQRLCKWFESLTTPEDIQAFLSGLLSLKYTKEQREQMGLHTPSERLLSLAVLRMSIKDDEVTKQVNNLVIALLRSYNNPLDFPESGLIDAKLVELIKSTVVKEGFSIPLAQTTDLIVRIPRALDSENAVEIAKLIIANYPKSDNEDYEIAMLLTLLKCIDSSPGANTTAADNKFVEEAKNLSATTQKMLLSEIETIWGDRSDKVGILKQKVINQTWAWVKENIDKPDDELFLSVDICRNYQEIVPEDEIKDFFRKTLLLTDASKVHTYSEFIVKRILQYAGDFVAECAHAIEGNIGNTDIDGGCREEYLLVLIKLLLQTSEDIKDEMFLKLTNRLLDGDKVLLSLIPNHYVELCEATGDSITRDFAESLFNRILEDEEGELDIYSALYKQILSGFELKAEQSSRLAKRISDELPSNYTKDHKKLILEMTNSMVLIGGEKQNLSRVMYVYKESGDDADLKGLSWEKYLMLKGKDIIDEYIPPQPMDEETL